MHRPTGISVLNTILSGSNNAKIITLVVDATDSTPIYINDPVKNLTDSDEISGFQKCTRALPGDFIRGIVVGIKAEREKEDVIYRTANTKRFLRVREDPFLLCKATVNAVIEKTDVNRYIDIDSAVGNVTTGTSEIALDYATINTSAGQFRIVRMLEVVDTDEQKYSIVECVIQKDEYLKGYIPDLTKYVKKAGDGTAQQVAGGESSGKLTFKAYDTDTKEITISGGGFRTEYVMELASAIVPDDPGEVPDNGYIDSADRSVSGGWFFPAGKPPEYTTLPTLTLDKQLAHKKYVDDLCAAVNGVQAYFVDKHGSDTNNGKSWKKAFLTFQKAFDVIALQSPSQTKQFAVFCHDGGEYQGNFSMAAIEWTTVYAPATYIHGDNTQINSNCTVTVQEIKRLTPSAVAINKVGSGTAYLNVTKIIGGVGDGLIFVNDGILNVNAHDLIANTTTNFIADTDPAHVCEFRIKAKRTKGRIIINTSGTGYLETDVGDTNINVSAGRPVYAKIRDWTGNIISSGALSKIYLEYDNRNSNPASDSLSATAFLYINGKTVRRHATAINYNPSILTDHRLIAVTSTGTPRSVVISTEDIQSGTVAVPRYFTVKDEGGGAAANNITVSGETGTIDGVANFPIQANGDSITCYSDGTNLHIV